MTAAASGQRTAGSRASSTAVPLVSFGGSAMLPTLVAVGILLSFARCEPAAAAALRARPGLPARPRHRGRRPAGRP